MQTIASEIKQSQATKVNRFRKVVLAGNPNVGKSVIFNALTGMAADVSNYPGTTIDIARGKAGNYELVDTPGAYGVSSFNDEERAARRLILEADAIVNVVSALSLDRDLFLTLQLIDMGKPLLLVINQWDEAARRGLKIDVDQISQLLDIHVLTCVAVARQGIDRIMLEVEQARIGNVDKSIYEIIKPLREKEIPQAYALLIAEGDEASAKEFDCQILAERGNIYRLRRTRANEIVGQVISQEVRKQSFSVKLGRWLLHPFYGSVIAVAVCYFLFYQVLGVLIAGNLVDLTEKKGMRVFWEPLVRKTCATILPADVVVGDTKFVFPAGTLADANQNQQFEQALAKSQPDEVEYNFWPRAGIKEFIGTSIAGDYGVLTLTVTYLLGLLMPLVLGFYLGLSLLEDSGYLPRLAVLVDRVMMKMGLNGRAIIPLILGLGCVTMATITTRLLTTKREKLIATALLGVAIPCSAQLGVVSGTLARCGGMVAWSVYGLVVATILGVTGLLLNMVLPGQSGSLVIDLPPMRMPRLDNVLKKTWSKSWNFLMESIPMFALAGFVVTIAQVTGILDFFIACLRPITVNWLNLPSDPRVATTFILGIVRRDFAAFGLTDVAMTTAQAVVAMVVITLFVPCIATVGVMIKERGMKVAMTIWLGSWMAAFAIGGALAHALPPILSSLGHLGIS
jgi:ferrous iron transport protein B